MTYHDPDKPTSTDWLNVLAIAALVVLGVVATSQGAESYSKSSIIRECSRTLHSTRSPRPTGGSLHFSSSGTSVSEKDCTMTRMSDVPGKPMCSSQLFASMNRSSADLCSLVVAAHAVNGNSSARLGLKSQPIGPIDRISTESSPDVSLIIAQAYHIWSWINSIYSAVLPGELTWEVAK